jgi:glycerol-3-phosphate acyltransferase PlsY
MEFTELLRGETLLSHVLPLAALAYLLGSIPTAVWWGKGFYGVDVRKEGSLNSGATNTFRVLGRKAGIPVLIIDILKGYAAACLVYSWIPYSERLTNAELSVKVVLGGLAVIGHLFPVFANFKGGKGVATSFGVISAVNWEAAGISLGIFLVVFAVFHFVSLGSILASIAYPFTVLVLYPDMRAVMVVFSLLLASVIIFMHRSNIRRLLNGTENKLYLFGRGQTVKTPA